MTPVRIMQLTALSRDEVDTLLTRRYLEAADVTDTCRQVIESVRRDGDQALLDLTRRYDGVDLKASDLRVPPEAFDQAQKRIARPLYDAIQRAIGNVRTFHQTQVPQAMEMVEVDQGVWCGERWTPIDSVCLYVPRGRGTFPSVAYMLGVPAKLAGVSRIILCTPPGPEGDADDATLVAARLMGIDEIYHIGGAQAVAAVAYGTATIPRCAKIVGPGNVYVSGARRLLAGTIDPGPPAGPSESLILGDESVDPANAAWNLMIEAEHGENSCALFVTHVPESAQAVGAEVERLCDRLTEPRRRFVDEVLSQRGGIVITRSLDESIDFSNRFAAEHVALMVADPWSVLSRITCAGEILLGDFPIISLGNYAMGINAILPTGGWARTTSGVSVQAFMKRTSVGFVTADAFESLKEIVPLLSRDEGFSAHHEAVLDWRYPNRTSNAKMTKMKGF